MSLQTKEFYEFANFRLDLSEKVLLNDGKPVPLTPKVFDTLVILIENAGRLLEKDELMQKIWQDRFVEETNLTANIKMLRKALGDDAAKPRFIETVQRRGYRFIAEVKEFHAPASPARKNVKPDNLFPVQNRYFLIGIGIISLVGIFGIAFVWFNGSKSPTTKQLKFTRLTTIGKVTNAVVAPDGKSLVFAQKEAAGEGLWLRQIDTGNQTQILPPQKVEYVGLTVSPDSNYAYYSVFAENFAVSTLSRISLSGGLPESLPAIATDVSVSFSPDGKKFAFTESLSSVKETYLKTADADGSNQKTLLTTKGEDRIFPIFRASPVAWSPDGETIACAVQETDGNGSFYKVLLVNPNDGREKYLSEKSWNFVGNIVWKDADNLALIEYEMNSPVRQIWLIERKTGAVRRLTGDLNAYEWLSSANRNLFTLQKTVFSSLHIADFTENSNTLQPKQILGESSLIDNAAWSNDGKIFYNSRSSGKNEIWQVNPDGTAPRQLTTDSNLIFSFAVSPFDDRLVFSTGRNGRISLSTADSNGQNMRQLTDGTSDIAPGFSPDGKIIVFQRGAATPTLWRVGAEGNQPPAQLTGYLALHPVISPDGKKIAYHFMDYGGKNPRWKVGLIDSENRRLLNKLDFPFPITERKTVWHPNSNFLTMIFNKGENVGILLLSASDGKFQTIENIAVGKITSFAWSPDGSRFAFSQSFESNDVVSLGDL